MSERVFKVVLRQGEAMWSSSTRCPQLITRYFPHVEVFGDYPLFVFSSLYYALEYVYPLQSPFEIWDAESGGEVYAPKTVARNQSFAEGYWRNEDVPVVPAFPGTLVCERLTLKNLQTFTP